MAQQGNFRITRTYENENLGEVDSRFDLGSLLE
jgi:hypothetical protein